MHIDLPSENVTEVSTPYKEHYEKLFSRATVTYESSQNTTVSPTAFTSRPTKNSSAKTVPPIWTALPSPITRGSWEVFKPDIEHWPPLVETPESTGSSYNKLHVGILGGVVIVVFFWVIVIGVVLRNKIQARRQRRQAREPPPYLDLHYNYNSALSSSDFSNMDTSPQFGLSEQTDSSIVDIETTVENSPSFSFYQPSAPNATTQNCTNEQPPSYTESQQENSKTVHSRGEDQPPSYEEAQKQSMKNVQRN